MKSYHSIEYPMFFSIAFSYTSCATRASKIPIPTDLKQRVSLCVCGRPLCVSSIKSSMSVSYTHLDVYKRQYLNKVPYLVIRAISDKADGSAGMDYAAFEAKAIEHSVKLLMEMVARL